MPKSYMALFPAMKNTPSSEVDEENENFFLLMLEAPFEINGRL